MAETNNKKKTIFEERQEFIDKYGTVKFTRFDPEIKAERIDRERWSGCPPYRINILCDYIRPLYERYKRLVSPGVGPLSDAQRYDFECIIILAAKEDMPPDEKIKLAERQIDSIKENPWDYLPNTAAKIRDLYPTRANGTIYEGLHKFAAKEPLPIEEYRKLFEV